MGAYSYIALDANGKKIKGLLEGDSERQVRGTLRARDLKPIEVSASRGKQEREFELSFSRSHWTVADLALVTRQLATLVQSGLPLAECLEAVAAQTKKPSIKSVLISIRSRVMEGHSLAQAMGEHPKVFGDLYCGMVRAGEHAGFLGVVLERLSDYTEQTQHSNQRIKNAMIYPAVLVLVSVSVIVLLMIFIVPQLIQIFDNTDTALPLLTVMLIETSNFISNYGIVVILVLVALIVAFRLWLRLKINQKRWHHFLTLVPLVSSFINKVNTTRFASTLGTLIDSGVPLHEALVIARSVLSNLHYRGRAETIVEAVREGKSLRYALESSELFPPMMVHMVGSGERSGELGAMLQRSSEAQARELDSSLDAMLGIMEPLLVLFMGGFVFLIVMAILLPIFGMNRMFN